MDVDAGEDHDQNGSLYLDRFRLIQLIGQGGMGEVWLAHDPKLGRRVAIKILSPVRPDSGARQRFEREIRSLATCTHSVIARIFEAGEAAWPQAPHRQVPFIVMELVKGETLAEKIRRGPLPMPDALAIICRLLEGLAVAHDNHLVHRDIKPANLMITAEGDIKLLDLGLTRLVHTRRRTGSVGNDPLADHDKQHDPEKTLTLQGELVGTPRYMSPEQAKGRSVDARSDIWSVGLVLVEMLRGERVVRGRSSVAALLEIASSNLDPRQLLPGAPDELVRILSRCLSQDLRLRYHHARDLLHDLLQVQLLTPRRSSRLSRLLRLLFSRAALAGLVVVLAVSLIAIVGAFPRPKLQPVLGTLDLGFDGGSPVLAPDGTQLFYIDGSQRVIKMAPAATSGNHLQVLVSEQTINNLAISPDCEWLYFDRSEADGASVIYRVPASGGTPRCVTLGWAPAISRDGRHLACFDRDRNGKKCLWVCRSDGGNRRMVTQLDGPLEPLSSCFTQDNQQVLVSRTDFFHQSELLRIHIGSGSTTVVRHLSSSATAGLALLPTGNAVIWSTSAAPHQLFNESSLVATMLATGETSPISMMAGTSIRPTLSTDGAVALFRTVEHRLHLGEIAIKPGADNPAARIEPLPLPANSAFPRVSPDGRMIAYTSREEELWLFDRTLGASRHLASIGISSFGPAWSPDGRSLAFAGLRDGQADIWLTNAEGTAIRNLTNDEANDFQPSWHPDGSHLVWISDRDGTESLHCISTTGTASHRLISAPAESPAVSPDGGAIAFVVQTRTGKSLRLHRLTADLQLGPELWRLDGRLQPWAGYKPRFSPDGLWLGFDAPVEPAGGDLFAVPLSAPDTPPTRLTALPYPTFTRAWWDWIDADRVVVSHCPVQARLLLLRDADRWIGRALTGPAQ
jgi:serine/threonine protein kinase/Tol biopolymer transport system component